jgi:hypothetical protein
VPSRTVDAERLTSGRVRRGDTAASRVAALFVRGTRARRMDGWFHVVDRAVGSNGVPGFVRSAPVIGFGIHDD